MEPEAALNVLTAHASDALTIIPDPMVRLQAAAEIINANNALRGALAAKPESTPAPTGSKPVG